MTKKIIFLILLILYLALIIGCSSEQITKSVVNPAFVKEQDNDKIICTCGCNRPAVECPCPEAKKLLEKNN